jgi:hypothetical protein
MASSSTSIGVMVNHGHIATGGVQEFEIKSGDSTMKRARGVSSEIVIYVKDPKHPTFVRSGMYGWEKSNTIPYYFDRSKNPLFWQLWQQFDGRMLRLKTSDTVFDNPMEPLENLDGKKFILCRTLPIHKDLFAQLMVVKLEAAIRSSDEIIASKKARIAELEEEKKKYVEELRQFK